ncbi:MAG: hypothetical protein LBF69_02095 [Prevotellaceae bacterium]|nr:hypothetical protein [Prevotellaceae bacterium]
MFDGVTNKNATFAPSEQNLTITQMLEGTTPIETPKHSFRNFDEAKKWAKENIVDTYKNDNTGEDVYISKKAIDKYLSASAVLKSVNKDAHLSVLKVMPELLKTSLLKEKNTDRADDYHIKEIQRFYGAISYEGQTHPIKITVKATRNEGNKAYSYEVLDIENPVEQNLPGQSTSSGQWNASASKDRHTFPHLEVSTNKDTDNFETTKQNVQNSDAVVFLNAQLSFLQ